MCKHTSDLLVDPGTGGQLGILHHIQQIRALTKRRAVSLLFLSVSWVASVRELNCDSWLSVGDVTPILSMCPDHSPELSKEWLFTMAVSEQHAGKLLLDNKRWMSAA